MKIAWQSLFLASIFAVGANADCFTNNPTVREPEAFYRRQATAQSKTTLRQSNIINQQDLKSRDEKRVDMLPCRANTPLAQPHQWRAGQTIQVDIQCNNPHNGMAEINLWRDGQVLNVLKGQPFGGGFGRTSLNFTIPPDFPPCDGTTNKCFMQWYWYTVEPRDYANCADFVIVGGDAPAAGNTTLAASELAFQPAKNYSDGGDYAMDDDYNPYRGQVPDSIPPENMARWKLRSYVSLGEQTRQTLDRKVQQTKRQIKNEIDGAIKQLEQKEIQRLREAFRQNGSYPDADLYNQNVKPQAQNRGPFGLLLQLRLPRQFRNTYIPNIAYDKVLAQFQDKLTPLLTAEEVLKNPAGPQLPPGYPKDPFANFRRNRGTAAQGNVTTTSKPGGDAGPTSVQTAATSNGTSTAGVGANPDDAGVSAPPPAAGSGTAGATGSAGGATGGAGKAGTIEGNGAAITKAAAGGAETKKETSTKPTGNTGRPGTNTAATGNTSGRKCQ